MGVQVREYVSVCMRVRTSTYIVDCHHHCPGPSTDVKKFVLHACVRVRAGVRACTVHSGEQVGEHAGGRPSMPVGDDVSAFACSRARARVRACLRVCVQICGRTRKLAMPLGQQLCRSC